VCAGQGHRELDQPEGRRGRVPREGQALPPLRRRRGGDGLRRAGSGRYGGPQGRDLPARLRHPHIGARLRAAGHHLRPQHLCRRDRPRRAQRVRQGLHRGHAPHQGGLPGSPDLGWSLQPLVLLPGQRPRARGDPLGLPLPRHPGRHGHGDRERRAAPCSTGARTPPSA
jgi:hypothetical protein